MKKSLFFSVLMLFAVAPMFAQSEEVIGGEQTDSVAPHGIYPYEKEGVYKNENVIREYTGWSLRFPFGYTAADMDETGGAKLGSGLSNATVNIGVGVEYNFTPRWGVLAEFMVSNYGKNSFEAKKNSEGMRVDKDGNPASFGQVYNMGLNLTYDFMDAFFPERKSTLFSLYGVAGAGLGFYTYQSEFDDKWCSATGLDRGKFMKYDRAAFLNFGLLLDFNITRKFALGARTSYIYYLSDNLDYSNNVGSAGQQTTVNQFGDGLFTADLVLRYKIAAHDKSHIRNLNQHDYEMFKNEKQVSKLYAAESKKHPRQKDTLMVVESTSSKDTLVYLPEQMDEGTYVYFPNDKYTLDEAAMIRIQEIAFKLQRYPNYCLELTGFADNTGNRKHNEMLAERRADAVKRQLIEMYGIEEDRLVDLGCGTLTNTSAGFGPNRRVAMRIVTREEVERIRNQKAEDEHKAILEATGALKTDKKEEAEKAPVAKPVEEKVAEVVAPVEEKAAEVVEEAKEAIEQVAEQAEAAAQQVADKVDEVVAEVADKAEEAIEAAKAKVKAAAEEDEDDSEELTMSFDRTQYVAIVKTGKGTTLQKLAAKYYGDPEKWNVIYDANKETISNPSYIWPGTSLLIPVLH